MRSEDARDWIITRSSPAPVTGTTEGPRDADGSDAGGCLPDRYDDGGYTGANTDRPALRRLLADIAAGIVNLVVVYKVDRLSRKLPDFVKIIELFDEHNVSFVSVTQAFNTSTSMGRLVLNVLLSFAQFEREAISERTRDKIAAARRRGKWSGGMPLLGYTVENTKLVVNQREAERVRTIYSRYLELQSTLALAQELNQRGWTTKCWATRKGTHRGGRPWSKNSLYQLLTNVTYVGKVRYKEEVHHGEHEALIDPDTFAKVQALLSLNGKAGGRGARSRHHALLRDSLRCAACDCCMSHSYTKKGSRLYRYYVCQHAQKNGWNECPSPSLPVAEIERFVIDQTKCLGRDPAVIRDTLAQVRRQTELGIERLTNEKAALVASVRDQYSQLGRLAAGAVPGDPRLAEAQDQLRADERRTTEIAGELAALSSETIDEADVVAALRDFDQLWNELTPAEQSRVLELLIEQVTYDGHTSKLSITYRPTGIRALSEQIASRTEEAA